MWIKGTIGIYSYVKWLCSRPGYLALICSDVHVTPSWTCNDVDWMSMCKYFCTCLCSDSAQTPFGWRWIWQRRTPKIYKSNIFWIWQANNASTCAGAKDLLKLPNHKQAQIQRQQSPATPGDKDQHCFCPVFDWRGKKGSRSLNHCFTCSLCPFSFSVSLPLSRLHARCSSLTWKQSHSCLSSHFIAPSFPLVFP